MKSVKDIMEVNLAGMKGIFWTELLIVATDLKDQREVEVEAVSQRRKIVCDKKIVVYRKNKSIKLL